MKVELEFNTELTDMTDILQKISQIVKSAKEQGFDIAEVEVESDIDKQAQCNALIDCAGPAGGEYFSVMLHKKYF